MQPIDWTRPWYAHLARTGLAAERSITRGQPVWEALNQAGPAPVRFVPQRDRRERTAYEPFVSDTRECPISPGMHDFFNGLCWIGFPATKGAINRLHTQQIAAQGIGPRRGALRDVLTHFDEDGALLQAPEPLWQALAARQWRAAFLDMRALWNDARLLLFGHGLLEKLLAPRKSITAKVYRVPGPHLSLAQMDAWVAGSLQHGGLLAGGPLVPLQVLGVPGWWSDNTDPRFYADEQCFRPARGHPAADQ